MRVDAYRLVGPYDTFEDYCKDFEGLAWTTAQLKIKAYLVHSAIVENLGPIKIGPSLECQVKQLYYHEGAIANFKTEKRMVEKRDGTREFHIMNRRNSRQENNGKPLRIMLFPIISCEGCEAFDTIKCWKGSVFQHFGQTGKPNF